MTSRLTRVNGVLKIDIDGQIYEPLSFKSFRPTAKNISDFCKAGVKLFSILSTGLYSILGVPYSLYGESWVGNGQYDFDAIDRQIELFRENAPGCYFALMIQLDTRPWWLDSHENFPNSFTHLSQMASNTEWREAAAAYLQAVLTHVEEKYGDCVYGYFLMCGTTTEWFSDRDYEASHPFKEAYYKAWTGDPEAVIPSMDELNLPDSVSFSDNLNVKRYREAHAEQTADTILYFTKKTQEILRHRKLVGLYFGYLFELYGERLWNAGHLAYEKVFFSDDIDMISSPSAYGYRKLDSTSAFMLTYKTLDLHDKLYYLEFDHITHLAPSHIEGFLIPGGGDKCKNQTETLNLMQRDFMLCAVNGAALWWFDMFEGWFYSDEMMDSIRDMITLAKRLTELPQESAAEIAVIASGKSLYGVSKNSHLNDLLLGHQRNGLARMGAPYDIYTAGDLAALDIDRYKLFLFLDAIETDAAEDAAVARLKQAGKTLLWLYAPSYLNENGGPERMCAVTGMTIEERAERPAKAEGASLLPAPYFCVNDANAVPLANYGDGTTAIAYKVMDGWTSVYSAVGNLSGTLLRTIARLAGVHIYSDRDDCPVYVNNRMIGVYAFGDADILMKQDGVYEDLFTGKRYEAVNGKLHIPSGELASKLLLRTE